MGLKDFIKSELIDIIEWTEDEAGDTIVYKYPDEDKEIKNKAQLIVRESQVAVFVNEGQIADVYGPGHHELATANMPILSTLKGWKYGFESPFKVDVYFVNTKQFIDQKWGTQNPVTMRDKEFGMVRIRAFGVYSFKVSDAATFLREVFGTCASYKTSDVTGHLKSSMVSELSDMIAESGVAMLDLSAQYNELSGERQIRSVRRRPLAGHCRTGCLPRQVEGRDRRRNEPLSLVWSGARPGVMIRRRALVRTSP